MINPITVAIPFAGFCQSIHDARIDDALEMAMSYREEECIVEELEATITQEAFLELAKQFTAQFLSNVNSDSGLSITATVTTVHSPRDYFTGNDVIEASMPLEHLKTVRSHLLANHLTAWQTKVSEECSDRSGFVSFVSPDITAPDWSEDITSWRSHQIRIMLECLAECECGEEWEDSISETLASNGVYDNFLEDV